MIEEIKQLRRLKVMVLILILMILTLSYGGGLFYRHYLEMKQVHKMDIYAHGKNYELSIHEKTTEINRLELALETAFKENKVIQTLLNKDMEDWTAENVLATRDKLDSLPYGSWFESGHYVTGAFGSKLLAGTYWGRSGHKGVDIKPNSNNPYETIVSAISGKVVTWGRNDRLFGNYLVIESMDGQFQIKLAHLSSIAIFYPDGQYDLYEGMEFPKGTRLATMGNTGNSTGPHLHLEYYMYENDTWRLLNASAILDYIGE